MSFHSRLRSLPERFAAFIGTPVGIAIATILLVLAVGAVLTAWLACDGMRSIVKVNQIKQLKEAFAAISKCCSRNYCYLFSFKKLCCKLF